MSASQLTDTPPLPLTQDHLDALNQVLQMEAIQQDHLHKCVQCGLGVDKLKADSDRRIQLANLLKQQFFPHAV